MYCCCLRMLNTNEGPELEDPRLHCSAEVGPVCGNTSNTSSTTASPKCVDQQNGTEPDWRRVLLPTVFRQPLTADSDQSNNWCYRVFTAYEPLLSVYVFQSKKILFSKFFSLLYWNPPKPRYIPNCELCVPLHLYAGLRVLRLNKFLRTFKPKVTW